MSLNYQIYCTTFVQIVQISFEWVNNSRENSLLLVTGNSNLEIDTN